MSNQKRVEEGLKVLGTSIVRFRRSSTIGSVKPVAKRARAIVVGVKRRE
jgi:hypothetical protein